MRQLTRASSATSSGIPRSDAQSGNHHGVASRSFIRLFTVIPSHFTRSVLCSSPSTSRKPRGKFRAPSRSDLGNTSMPYPVVYRGPKTPASSSVLSAGCWPISERHGSSWRNPPDVWRAGQRHDTAHAVAHAFEHDHVPGFALHDLATWQKKIADLTGARVFGTG